MWKAKSLKTSMMRITKYKKCIIYTLKKYSKIKMYNVYNVYNMYNVYNV